jgi:organic hydroperoxide reductase OsmC/OhrA
MGDTHRHHVVAWWTSGRTGIAQSDSAPNAIHFTAPPEFQGLEGRWTPEDLLLCALASCFTTTFQAIAGYARFEYTDLAADVEGVVSKVGSGYAFSEIVLRPHLTIPCKEERERAVELLQKAKKLCLVSRALATAQKFETKVEVSYGLTPRLIADDKRTEREPSADSS